MMAPKSTKGTNSTKEVNDLCTENFIGLMRKTKINGERSHIYGLEELILVKMSILPTAI